MKSSFIPVILLTVSLATAMYAEDVTVGPTYIPSEEVKKSQREFAADRFGIFIHWGIYSMFGQGEWYLNYGPRADEYAKAAKGFYPADFNADQWAKAIKDAGARYICFTSRHHDGFSMWDTEQSDYNIVDATPFKRDVIKELSDACRDNDLKLHLYYSHIDWTRPDYPRGRTGHTPDLDSLHYDWKGYRRFMDNQLTELLTNYGPIRCIWFDGWWDHDEDKTPFDWELPSQYALVHNLQPGCLIGNNHHQNIFPGEDIQIFERDRPGENTAGYSSQDISMLPLETCNTMNGMWGYRIEDTDYKDSRVLINYLVRTAGQGANLLLNIGPQPNGELPAQALERLHDIGVWMRKYGETIYSTEGSLFKADWGTSTRLPGRTFIHILSPESTEIFIPGYLDIKEAFRYGNPEDKLPYTIGEDGVTLHLPYIPEDIDFIVELSHGQ